MAPVESLLVEKDEAIERAGKIWDETVAEIPALKKRLRAEVEVQIEAEVAARRARAALAIDEALNSGATKTALRQVTTKSHNDFEEYVALGADVARRAARNGRRSE